MAAPMFSVNAERYDPYRTFKFQVLITYAVFIEFFSISVGMRNWDTLINIAVHQQYRNVDVCHFFNRIDRPVSIRHLTLFLRARRQRSRPN